MEAFILHTLKALPEWLQQVLDPGYLAVLLILTICLVLARALFTGNLFGIGLGIVAALLVGLLVVGIDFLVISLLGFRNDLTSSSALIVITGSLLAAIIGFFLGESITVQKVVGIVVIITTSVVLLAFIP